MTRPSLECECVQDYPYGDRCQELVFIGKDLKHREMQRILDTCLLTDEEMKMGERAWQREWCVDIKSEDLIT